MVGYGSVKKPCPSEVTCPGFDKRALSMLSASQPPTPVTGDVSHAPRSVILTYGILRHTCAIGNAITPSMPFVYKSAVEKIVFEN